MKVVNVLGDQFLAFRGQMWDIPKWLFTWTRIGLDICSETAICAYVPRPINCVHLPFINLSPLPGSCAHGDVRLMGAGSDMEGRVEVCWNGVWGTVVADLLWNRKDARVVCRQLAHHDLSKCGWLSPSSSDYVTLQPLTHSRSMLLLA